VAVDAVYCELVSYSGRIPVFQGKNREICWLRWPWSTTAWLVLWTFQLLSSCLRGVSSREFFCPNREFARACREPPTTTVVATAKWVSALPPRAQSDVLAGSPPVNARPLRGFSVRHGSHEASWMTEPSASQIARGCKPAILRLGVLGRFARRRMSTDRRECYRTPRAEVRRPMNEDASQDPSSSGNHVTPEELLASLPITRELKRLGVTEEQLRTLHFSSSGRGVSIRRMAGAGQ
jgi:hypothetical protein